LTTKAANEIYRAISAQSIKGANMRRIALVVLAIASGCASVERDLGDAKASWQGAGYDEIVLRWGAPARSTKLSEGRDAYTWVSEGAGSHGTLWPSIGIFGGSGGVGIGTGVTMGPGGGEFARCERTMVFKDGRVVEQTWQGSAEYCSTFRRT
jgi:hypothetical protein